MKHFFLLFFIAIFLLPQGSICQNSSLEKGLAKVNKLLKENKVEKADKKLAKLLDKNPSYGQGWDLMSRIKYFQWESGRETPTLMSGRVKVEVESGADEEALENAKKLEALLNGITLSNTPYNVYIDKMREGALKSNNAFVCSMNLRKEKIKDTEDSDVNEEAKALYDEGEKLFFQKKYEEAALKYKRAIDAYPNYYKAKLYLGDAYYFLGLYPEAIEILKEVKKDYPDKLEPRKYLVDAYHKEGLYESCLKEAQESFVVYPDLSMHGKLRDAATLNNKELKETWIPRGCFPNTVNNEFWNELKLEKNSPWNYYKSAKSVIKEFCDENGIISKENELTESKYLEVFSWEKMLSKTDSNKFKFAKEMKELGYLDCYVFITCFHPDIYEQYHHFAKNNEDKIIEYLDLLMK